MTVGLNAQTLATSALDSSLLLLERLVAGCPDPQAGRRLRPQDLQPHLPTLGITRVGDITGLDRFGLPVWFACRPRSLSLSVSQGKGLDHDQGWVSAVMESAESAHAERHDRLVQIVATRAEMKSRGLDVVALEHQTRCAVSRVLPDQPLAWVKGLSWRTGKIVYAPYELIGMDMLTHSPWDSRGFQISSVGLGAGGNMSAAITQGIMELIEDDALATDILSARRERAEAVLQLRSTTLLNALEVIAAQGCKVTFRQLNSDTSLAVVQAEVVPDKPEDHSLPAFGGYAARNCLEDAALAALLEAVQTRLTFIAGSREDVLPAQFAANPEQQRCTQQHVILPDDGHNKNELVLDRLVHCLFEAEVPDIFVFPLGGEEMGFHVVRVLASDMLAAARPEGVLAKGRVARNVMKATLG